MTASYRQSVLDSHLQAFESINQLAVISETIGGVLAAIEDQAEGDCRAEVIDALARVARDYLRHLDNATSQLSEYYRAADAARQGK